MDIQASAIKPPTIPDNSQASDTMATAVKRAIGIGMAKYFHSLSLNNRINARQESLKLRLICENTG